MLSDLPAGSRCFVDTNILYYHFAYHAGVTEQCRAFLKRIIIDEIVAVSTTSVVADVIHKVMISEAAAHFGFSSTGVSVQLRQVRSKLSQLQTYRAAIDEISRLPIALLSVEMSDIKTATQITSEFGLLTNDALIVAAMRRHGISHLATNDDDFDAVKEVVVWKPR